MKAMNVHLKNTLKVKVISKISSKSSPSINTVINQKSVTVNVAAENTMGEEPLVVMRFLSKDFQLGSQTILLGREELCT